MTLDDTWATSGTQVKVNDNVVFFFGGYKIFTSLASLTQSGYMCVHELLSLYNMRCDNYWVTALFNQLYVAICFGPDRCMTSMWCCLYKKFELGKIWNTHSSRVEFNEKVKHQRLDKNTGRYKN